LRGACPAALALTAAAAPVLPGRSRSLLKRAKEDPRAERKDAQELLALPKKRIPEYRVSQSALTT
jgi:hypothetical protein